ncbi:hypothetical protein ACOMHN_021533 [Nucella lapillus]
MWELLLRRRGTPLLTGLSQSREATTAWGAAPWRQLLPLPPRSLFDPPHSGQRFIPPQSGQRFTPPHSGQRFILPQSGQRFTPPHSGQRFTPPHSGQRFIPPQLGQRFTPPHSGQRFTPPQSGQRFTPPQLGQRFTPPHSGQRFTPPQSTGSEVYSSPLGSEVYSSPLGSEVYSSPLGSEVYSSPVGSEVYSSPLRSEVYSSPVGSEVYSSPLGSEDNFSPVGSEPMVPTMAPWQNFPPMGFSQHPAQGFMWWPGFIPDAPDTQASSFSFSEAVDLLARHTPDAVATAQGDKTSYLSAAELALGSKPLSAPAPSLPKESSMVANSMRRVQLRVRGAESQEVSPGSVPDLPGAMACGKFLKPEKLPFSRKACIVHDLIPGTALALSQEDLLLLQEESRSQQRRLSSLSAASLSGKRQQEEAWRRCPLWTPSWEAWSRFSKTQTTRNSNCATPPAVVSFILSMAEELKYLADAFARLHMNSVLARRDAVLSASQVTRSQSCRASLRALPMRPGSLFGNHVQATLGARRRSKGISPFIQDLPALP